MDVAHYRNSVLALTRYESILSAHRQTSRVEAENQVKYSCLIRYVIALFLCILFPNLATTLLTLPSSSLKFISFSIKILCYVQ